MSEQRPLRLCDVCGGVDDHPRHVIAFSGQPDDTSGVTSDEVVFKALKAAGEENGAAILAQARDNSTTMRHMDCCREAGCPDGTCDEVTKGAEDLRGDDLVQHLTSER